MAQTLGTRDIQKLIDQVNRDGYVVIPHAFSAAQVSQAKAELARLSGTAEAGPAGQAGRNTFEGLRTQRIYALLNKARCFDQFALHPAVLALNDYFLDEGYLLNALHSVNIGPGEAAQRLHHDDEYVTVPRPHRPFGAAIMVALDDYTPTNGGTNVVPRSHTWAGDRVPARSEAVAVAMPAGQRLGRGQAGADGAVLPAVDAAAGEPAAGRRLGQARRYAAAPRRHDGLQGRRAVYRLRRRPEPPDEGDGAAGQVEGAE
ncbi:phytanoyl-CoA dioxygenase family protein [Metarhizium guizhouense ARSEF 977]|uniref:Phytanoyl-CoA dioxygenase family protein n=1 Tax=Metarhizium guizhouense (strain ARSEF 977) TaxID=1276136 RepID=A0A0B4IA87_METGA|nr:phytanoyl-CoA dioxygenase family protein [Metarhizium guizhouense ARSEF 977]